MADAAIKNTDPIVESAPKPTTKGDACKIGYSATIIDGMSICIESLLGDVERGLDSFTSAPEAFSAELTALHGLVAVIRDHAAAIREQVE